MDDFPWFAPITKFEQAFGEIEESTVSLLACLPDCKIPLTASKLTLGMRLDILQEVLPRHPGPEYGELLMCFQEVATLTSKRALIAHNAVWFGYQTKPKVDVVKPVGSDRQRRLSLEEVSTLAEKAEVLATRVTAAMEGILQDC